MKESPLNGSDIGSEYYNECRFHDFNPLFATSLATMVDLCRGEDEEFMCDFWDSLRDYAHEDKQFASMLMESKVMEREDIYGISDDDEEFDYEDDVDSENF